MVEAETLLLYSTGLAPSPGMKPAVCPSKDLLMTRSDSCMPHGGRPPHATGPTVVSRCRPTAVLAATAVLLAWLPLPSSAAVVLFDNLSAGSPNGSSGVSNTQWLAQGFSTTTAGFVLDEVSVQLWNNTGTTGNFELQVWDALGASGSPGSQVGSAIYTGLAQSLSSSPSGLLTASSLGVTLAATTDYYLVARGTSLTDVPGPGFSFPGSLAWNQTNVVTTPMRITTDSAASWLSPTRNSFMSVTAVPEPSTGILLAAGFVAWCCCHRLRNGERCAPRPAGSCLAIASPTMRLR